MAVNGIQDKIAIAINSNFVIFQFKCKEILLYLMISFYSLFGSFRYFLTDI